MESERTMNEIETMFICEKLKETGKCFSRNCINFSFDGSVLNICEHFTCLVR